MIASWTDAIVMALVWGVTWGILLICYGQEWNTKWLQPGIWYLFARRKLKKSREIFLNSSKLPEKIQKPIEEMLNVLETNHISKSQMRMDKAFRRKVEHEIELLQKNNICREIRMAYMKLPEEDTKRQNFRHWNDAGREWREVVLQGTVLSRYRDKQNGKYLYEDFFSHGAVLLRQSRHIRHNETASKNRNEEQQFYSQYQNAVCPSCGGRITLTSDEEHCPYCGGYIKSDFFDWQTEEFLIYREKNPNSDNLKQALKTVIVFFLPAVPCFRLISNEYIALGSTFVITIMLALFVQSRLNKKAEEAEKLKEQIARYDEKVLLADINEALYDTIVKPETVYYSVGEIVLKAVENTAERTKITVQAVLHQLSLLDNRQIVPENQTIELSLCRARHPERMKSKGQAVFKEKECPSCGANFIPDAKGCCSFCGYRLQIDNSKWRMDTL